MHTKIYLETLREYYRYLGVVERIELKLNLKKLSVAILIELIFDMKPVSGELCYEYGNEV
jgi:hypothetical protein